VGHAAVNFFNWQLKGIASGKEYLTGQDSPLLKENWTVEQKGFK
jgi:hypothetical protein